MTASKNVSNFLVRGLVAPPVTPFKPNGDLNLAIFDQYVKYLGEFSVSNVFVTGTKGEGMLMAVAERKLVVEAWVKAANEKLSCVMVQVGTENLRDSQELARHAQATGANAIACVGPTYFKPETLESYVSYMKEVAAAAPDLPFYLYDIDFVTGITFAAPDFFRAAKDVIPTLRGVKHTTPSITNMTDMLAEFGERFQVLCGMDELYLASLAIGVETGVMNSFTGNVLRRLKAAFDKGDLETARLEQHRANALVKIQAKIGFGTSGGTRAMLQILGVETGQPRLPLAPVPQHKVDQLRKEITDIGFFDWGLKK